MASLFQVNFVSAQIVYGVGNNNGGVVFDRVFIVNPTTGLASTPTVANTFAPVTDSAALAVSPINGLVYLVERAVANPRIVTWNPNTGASVLVGSAGTPAAINTFLRATFCPDGRFYIAANGSGGGAGAEIYEINPANATLRRTLTLSNVPGNGSGDIVCQTNGDLSIVAQSTAPTTATGAYQMYRLTAAQLAVPGTFTTAASFIANSNITSTQAFNGLSETPSGQFLGSVGFNQTAVYSINPTTFVANTLTTTDFARFADLSRGFPLGISVSKSQTPTSLIQGTQTVIYTVDVRNAGPAVAGNVSVIDTLPSAYQTVTWVCGVLNAGLTTTAVTTACGATSGTGNVNTTASLSINGTVRYTITAVLSSTFTGTLTNVANGTVSSLLTVLTPTATISTVTATVQPAANLSVTKTDGITTTVAGGTLVYTVTFTNSGPGGANNAVIQDVPSAGLASCTVLSCTPTGTATCPGTPANLLAPSTTTIPTFPANTSVTFQVRCRVTAIGL
ncbi:DUF11 domain-containing protein [Variovorax sp. PCZ-1]|uniref:DUF11 domain-containing protein n=1 Tax=Variovorax sp. PCZ-1 TaxID=2835533 RepID=UPI001BCE8802|nr:DUF11 domain-containing protein [Variovorax sp. PCZ-1]MBS7806610.1 DUF11 domain-containing protein [Variovorax sp. PCZ-1]